MTFTETFPLWDKASIPFRVPEDESRKEHFQDHKGGIDRLTDVTEPSITWFPAAPRRAGLSRRRVWHSRLESRGSRHLHNAESERIFRVFAEIPLSRPSHRRPCGCRPCHAHDPGERGTVRNS